MLTTPALVARALLDELLVKGVPDVRAVAAGLGVEVEEADVDSFDGALVRVKGTTEGLIAVRRSIKEAGRKNFTIAHELGHLLLPGHDESIVCRQGEVEAWDGKTLSPQEIEANVFAGELLLPTPVLAQRVIGREPSFDLVEQLARQFSTSLTATAYRVVEVTSCACAVVWSEDGVTKWCKRSVEFAPWIKLRERLDKRTFASDCFVGTAVPNKAHSVSADAWLDGALPARATLLEETRCMPSYSAALSLLRLAGPFDTDPYRADEMLADLDPDDFSLKRRRWTRDE